MENQHIQGYYRLWDTLVQRNPGLLIDSCASGGRRNGDVWFYEQL